MRLTAVYLLAGGAVVALFRDNPVVLIAEIARALPQSIGFFLHLAWWVVPAFVGMFLLAPKRDLLGRLPRAFLAVILCTAFFLVFTMLKTTMPFIWPFWADPMFAALDRVLHLGADPWVWTHGFAERISIATADRIYMAAWLVPAMYLPVLLILFDGDQTRINRFIWLYAFAWIGLGNLLALAFLSAGPVYFDRLFDPDLFTALPPALDAAGITDSAIGRTQTKLWRAFQSSAQEAGSGISAFPSVHVGMVTVFALYLFERHRLMVIPGIALVATFQFLSVYLGWHYAVDGYASILLVVALWIAMRKRPVSANIPEKSR
ncbi:phosphatase PAP2 family protein [Aliiroseovarius subalbicans]|uniref:phosphatase PAP2 family protein n=1 Tax=Aliiroseovarius subalbicans TaxID=2925840 RepID=UPI001F570046|nr:phosphatase PAP2 family protein [Aliiroseovarius subalbicans]MCI2399563.1 phosphatase PAP2 family protein [Aliiroseovarius subalbicans]